MTKPRILVVGSINQDFLFYNVLEHDATDTIRVYEDYKLKNGGKGLIQASAVQMLGAECTLVGCVGNDAYGLEKIKALKDLGINTDYIKISEDVGTGVTLMLLRSDRTYSAYSVVGGNGLIDAEMVEKALNENSFDMILMQLEMPLETVYKTYEFSKSKNIPCILDAGPAKSIPLERLKGIYMLTPNEDETYALTGVAVKDEENAEKACEILYKETEAENIVLKLGAKGAYLYKNGKGQMFSGYVVHAVDSTGAGDTFTAEMAIRLAHGESIERAIDYGNAAGALCVTREGGQSSIPAEEELEVFIKTNKGGYKNES